MKTIFSIYKSEDGLDLYCFTNIKALFNYIDKMEGYHAIWIGDYPKKDLPFNYNNLVKVIRKAQQNNQFTVACISCDNGELTVYENGIKSK